MKQELDDKLCREFPIIYRDRNENMDKTCMCWGFPNSGWFKLIYDMSQKLEALAKKQTAKDEEGNDIKLKAAQIKEKFAKLRAYFDNISDDISEEVDAAINEAERLSAITCEICGEPGKCRKNNYWLKTLCDKCNEEDQKAKA